MRAILRAIHTHPHTKRYRPERRRRKCTIIEESWNYIKQINLPQDTDTSAANQKKRTEGIIKTREAAAGQGGGASFGRGGVSVGGKVCFVLFLCVSLS